jgi:hypothetical protein
MNFVGALKLYASPSAGVRGADSSRLLLAGLLVAAASMRRRSPQGSDARSRAQRLNYCDAQVGLATILDLIRSMRCMY